MTDELRERLERFFEGSTAGAEITELDIYYCYRLLLEREPDPDGMAAWLRQISDGQITRSVLVEGFLGSAERRTLEAERLQPSWVELEDFRMLVRPSDPHIGAVIARDRCYEPHISAQVRRLLAPGGVFVDVGANIGYFSLLAARLVGPTGRVIAFEPRPDNVELLMASARDNGFAQIEVRPLAVAEKAQELAFFASGVTFSNGRIVNDMEPGSAHLPRVRAVRLDDELVDVPRVDVLKMDIEGAEPRALAGMKDLLRTRRPTVLVEFSPDLIRVSSRSDPADFLAALGENHRLHIVPRAGGELSPALTVEAILAEHARAGLTHLDLAAVPG